MEPLAIAFFMALITERLVAAVVAPVKVKYPDLDLWWLIYAAWVVGGALVWLTGTNLFAQYFPDPLVGRILTAVVAGGGANLLHDVFKPGEIIEVSEVEFTRKPFEPEVG